MDQDLPARGGIAKPPPEPVSPEAEAQRRLAQSAPPLEDAALLPTPREQLVRAIPMMILFAMLPFSAWVTSRFERVYIRLDVGSLPFLTECFIAIKEFIFDWTSLYILVIGGMIYAYIRWISKGALCSYVFNLLQVKYIHLL